MKSKFGTILMVLGAVLVLGALSLFLYNQYEESRAVQAADEVMPQLLEMIKNNQSVETDIPNWNGSVIQPDDSTTNPGVTTQPNDPSAPDNKIPQEIVDPYSQEYVQMDEVVLDGHAYIGYLSIPDVGLELPVMADWSYSKLKIAPCRYHGTVKGNDLVVMGHNYRKHFNKLKNLKTDNLVYFTDVNGNTTVYKVTATDVVQPTAVEKVTSGNHDLVLFTCTYGGRTRLTILCDRADST